MFLLFLITFIDQAFSQNVTSSFDRNMLSINPSAATTRTFAQIAISQTQKKVVSNVTQKYVSGSDLEYTEKVTLNLSEFTWTGAHSKLVPELYVGYNDGKKSTALKGSQEARDNELGFIDNFLNLAYKNTSAISTGLKIYFPTLGFNSSSPGRTQANTSYNYEYHLAQSTYGATVGTTIFLGRGFYFGFYGGIDQERRKKSSSFLDFETSAPRSTNTSETETFRRYGGGFSFMSGSSKRQGFRFETSMTYMNRPISENTSFVYGGSSAAELKAALEVAFSAFSVGINLRARSLGYYDRGDYVDKYFIQTPISEGLTSSLGGFFALSSEKGHSIGFSVYAFNSSGDRLTQGTEQSVNAKTTVLNVNYAYLF